MKKELGFARCGLACCLCSENENCNGCKADDCKDRETCKNRTCCIAKGLNGCWECEDFPCSGTLLDKPRIRAFAAYLKQYGPERLMAHLERNEQAGVRYHYAGQIVGDYDQFQTQDEIWRFIDQPGAEPPDPQS